MNYNDLRGKQVMVYDAVFSKMDYQDKLSISKSINKDGQKMKMER